MTLTLILSSCKSLKFMYNFSHQMFVAARYATNKRSGSNVCRYPICDSQTNLGQILRLHRMVKICQLFRFVTQSCQFDKHKKSYIILPVTATKILLATVGDS